MLTKILIGLAALVIVLAVIVVNRPSDFRVTRTAVISAPASVVFAQVNDLHKWRDWSPWAKLDPDAKNTFEGPQAGTGAVMRWAGNRNVGEGSMAITESRPNEFIRFKLDFLKPFAGTNTAEFTFTPKGHQTRVSWSMFGKNNFMSKAIGLAMDCDKMIGDQFEKGLADLRSVSEGLVK